MGNLPKLSNVAALRRTYQVQFGGLNHNIGASDGEIFDMKNMASDHYPVLTQRKKRKLVATLENAAGGMISYGGVIVYAEGTALKMVKNGVIKTVGAVTEGEKTFATFQNSVIVFPDKVQLNLDTEEFKALGTEITVANATFVAIGSLFGEAAENNTLRAAGIDFGEYFKKGDAVEISGCVKVESNNKTPIIREVDGNELRFYENVFTTLPTRFTYTAKDDLSSSSWGMLEVIPHYGFIKDGYTVVFALPNDVYAGTEFEWVIGSQSVQMRPANEDGSFGAIVNVPLTPGAAITKELDFVSHYGDVTESTVTLKKTIPDMDFVISDDNRLWGAKGNTIYGSKLGDPTNFNVFDGLSTDSYSVDIGNAGEITAALTYNGYPTFFKEDGIFRLYGDKPSNFQIMPTMKQGVKAGCAKSLAIAGEVLYYIGLNGIMAYSGGVPMKADDALGIHVTDGVAVSDGIKYYISATEDGEHYSLYVYDTAKRMWHKEDDLHLTYAVYDRAVLGLTDEKKLLALTRGVDGTEEEDFEWAVEFADMTFGSPFQKGIVKANIRFELQEGAYCRGEIQYDSGDEWEVIKDFEGTRKRSNILPVIPHRCDHFALRLVGKGICDIYSLAVQYYEGSENY